MKHLHPCYGTVGVGWIIREFPNCFKIISLQHIIKDISASKAGTE
jgi:hypothetical protein